ncbi:MAG: hypothetical protein AB7L36_01210 [Sphingomonadaceae bacterium]
MAALKKNVEHARRPAVARKATAEVRAVADGLDVKPVASPAHELQKALHEAGYRSDAFQARPLSNGMLVLTLICVYVMSMLMLFGSMAA